MRPLLSLILLFGLYSSSRAQIIQSLDQSFDVFPCINLDNEFYDIRSNQPLSLADYNLISNLDRELFINNLYPEDCFMFKLNKSDIVTFKLPDRDRSYLIENQKPIRVFDYYPTQTIIINIKN
jgi:hypothetical protein